VVTPNIPGPPPHYHATADEVYYVIQGSVDFLLDGTWHSVPEGQSLKIPKGSLHTFKNDSREPARFITVHSPGEKADGMFLTFGVAADEENGFERSISEGVISKLATEAADFDMIIQPR